MRVSPKAAVHIYIWPFSCIAAAAITTTATAAPQAPTILADNEGSPFHELGLKEVMDGVSNRRAGMQTELAAVGR